MIEHRFDDRLAVVEIALDRQGVDIGRLRGGHLALLHRRDLVVRKQDEDVGPVAAGEGLDRRAARVARGRADDRGALVAFGQHVIHQPRQHLHGDILERQRWPVEQFQHEFARPGLHQRTYGGVMERGIGLACDRRDLVLGDFAGNERRHDPACDLVIGPPAHGADVGRRELRPGLGQVEPAVARQPGHEHVGKAEDRGRSPG